VLSEVGRVPSKQTRSLDAELVHVEVESARFSERLKPIDGAETLRTEHVLESRVTRLPNARCVVNFAE